MHHAAEVNPHQFASGCIEEGIRGPSRIRTGDGGFAIRCLDSTSIDSANQLGQEPQAEVPARVPSPSQPVFALQSSPELARIATAWQSLPEAIKAGVLALIQAAEGRKG